MTRVSFAAAVLLATCVPAAVEGQDGTGFASDANRIIGRYEPETRDHTPRAMAAAAKAFLDSLDARLREQASLALDHPERRKWTNLPARPGAGGVRLGDCSDAQVRAFCDLMGTLLSDQGYAKMRNIMLADDQLLRGGRPRPGFGTENFSVVIFGEPSATGPWGFQLDGHHVGVNLAMQGDRLTMSPSFIGTQPEAYHLAGRRYRPLAGEMDGAFKLISSLEDDQRAQAVLRPKRSVIRTGPGTDAQVPDPEGVSCATFNDTQRNLLRALIAEWVNDLPPAHADRRMQTLSGEMDKMTFAWNGPTAADSDVSYTIQGPSLIIEYACQDIGGDPLDHLHTMYRDPTNEYGKQVGN